MEKQTKVILLYSIISCIFLYITENIFHPTYIVQMFQKVITFIVIPLFLGKIMWFTFWKFWKINKRSFLYWTWFWIIWVFVISLTYFLLSNIISWEAISQSLTNREVNETTFIFIFVYIMFWNSLVEEYFFRWIIFNSLIKRYEKTAYILSSSMFSFYHFAIFWAWFKWYILWLAIFWLFIWGLFFAWLYKKTKWIWSAWIFHIFSDFIILIIWYYMFFS